MKGIKKLFCVAVIGLCMTVTAGASEGIGNLPPQGAKAYLKILNEAQDAWGEARLYTFENYSDSQKMWGGLCLAKLIDFDGDDIPELYFAGRTADSFFTQYLYTYQRGNVIKLEIPKEVSNFGTDVSPNTVFFFGTDKAYLVDGHEIMNGGDVNYFTKQNNKIVSVLTYIDSEQECSLNG